MEKHQSAKQYIFASDFDQTLSFNDSGYVLAELLGIPSKEFERKATGMAKINLVQQGGELAYLLLHDPEFHDRVRVEHLQEVGKRIRLKENIGRLHGILDHGITGHRFEFFVVSAAPVEVIKSALEGIVPEDHIYGTQFRYDASGKVDTIEQVTAGYGTDRIVYVGDGSSDVHVMLHVNRRDGFTIAVSENKHLAPIAKRTVLSDNALGVLIPILEEIVGWDRIQIRAFLEKLGFSIQEWDKVSTDVVTIRDNSSARLANTLPRAEATRV